MLKSIKDDTEFQKEYSKLLEKYRHKHEVEYYEEIYKKVVDAIDDIRNTEGEYKSALECIAYMTNYPEDKTLFLDPDNLIVYFIVKGELRKGDSKGVEPVTITPELFKYFSKHKFIDLYVEE